MSDNRDAEFEAQMSDVAEEAATGVAAIKKGAKPGESIDTSGAQDTKIGGTDEKTEEGAKGTKNLGKAAAAPVSVEGDKARKRLLPSTTLLKMLTLLSLVKNSQKSSASVQQQSLKQQ